MGAQLPPLMIAPPLLHQIESAAVKAYPNECCGILIGRDDPGVRRILTIEAVANAAYGPEQGTRFAIHPRDIMYAESSAAASGAAVIGFFHSHPDHPARPSEIDRANAWPFYSYVIVSVQRGEAVDLTSWVWDAETKIFTRQDIIEAENEPCGGTS